MIYISLPYATFLLVDDDKGIICEAAPIAKWTIGRDAVKIVEHFRRKGAKIEYLDEESFKNGIMEGIKNANRQRRENQTA